MQGRLIHLRDHPGDIFIEDLLDGEQLVFRFNKKVLPYSLIDGEFLLKMGDGIVLNLKRIPFHTPVP